MGEGGVSSMGALASDMPEPPGAVMIVTPPISYSFTYGAVFVFGCALLAGIFGAYACF